MTSALFHCYCRQHFQLPRQNGFEEITRRNSQHHQTANPYNCSQCYTARQPFVLPQRCPERDRHPVTDGPPTNCPPRTPCVQKPSQERRQLICLLVRPGCGRGRSFGNPLLQGGELEEKLCLLRAAASRRRSEERRSRKPAGGRRVCAKWFLLEQLELKQRGYSDGEAEGPSW